jgi:hypothetical protein
MEQERDEVEFVSGRGSSQDQRGPYLGRKPKSVIQTSPGLTTGILILHSIKQ